MPTKKISLMGPSSTKLEQGKLLKDLLARNNLPRQPIILEKKKIKRVAPMQKQELKP